MCNYCNEDNSQLTIRRVTRGGEGEVSPALFQKLEKSPLICGKKCSDCGHLWVKFSFKMHILRVSRRKNRRFFPCEAFLSCVVGECLSKYPNSKKTPLPYKIPGYAPDIYLFNMNKKLTIYSKLTIKIPELRQ